MLPVIAILYSNVIATEERVHDAMVKVTAQTGFDPLSPYMCLFYVF